MFLYTYLNRHTLINLCYWLSYKSLGNEGGDNLAKVVETYDHVTAFA